MPHNLHPFTHRVVLRVGNFSSTPRCLLSSFCCVAAKGSGFPLCVCFMGFFLNNTHVCVCVHNTCIGSRNQGLKWATTSARTLDSPAYLPWRLAPSRVFSGFHLQPGNAETPQHVSQQIVVQIFALQRSPFWPTTWQKLKKETRENRQNREKHEKL